MRLWGKVAAGQGDEEGECQGCGDEDDEVFLEPGEAAGFWWWYFAELLLEVVDENGRFLIPLCFVGGRGLQGNLRYFLHIFNAVHLHAAVMFNGHIHFVIAVELERIGWFANEQLVEG